MLFIDNKDSVFCMYSIDSLSHMHEKNVFGIVVVVFLS